MCEVDTIVVGGGAIGLAIAWRIAQQGRQVTVLERGEPGSGASFHAAGMLAPITEASWGEDALLQLNLASARAYPAFLAELEAATGSRLRSASPGTLFVALDRDQLEALRRLAGLQASLGLQTRWLAADACREREPALHPSVRAGILAPEREIDARALTAALARAVGAAGGTLRPGAEVVRLLAGPAPASEPAPGDGSHGDPLAGEGSGSGPIAGEGSGAGPIAGESSRAGPIAGVELAGGEQIRLAPGGCVVLAAGCWSGGVAGVPPSIAAAVRPVKGQILRLRPRPGELAPIRHLVRTEEVYLVPRASGEVVVGATVEEQGFDRALTAGGVYELLRAAIRAVPAVRELELAEASAGLRPGTPDNGPLIGQAAPGLLVATGHFRNGILLAPVTAEAIAAAVAGGEPPAAAAPFRPDRFAGEAAGDPPRPLWEGACASR
jgi:glycine oxidase